MRTRFRLAVVLAVSVSLGSAVPTAAAAGRNGRISFTRWDYEADTSASWSIRPNGGDPERILAEGRRVTAAAYSPDGTQIAVDVHFGGAHHLQIVDLDGFLVQEVATFAKPVYAITWAPGGNRLAISRGRDIYLIRRDGSEMRRIAKDADSPRWSPDGHWILYMVTNETPDFGFVQSLRVVRPSGTGRHLVVKRALIPAWSPGGDRIAFYRFMPGGGSNEQADLFTVRRDGTGERRLTSTMWREEGPPVWSPDGRWLAFSRWSPRDVFDGDIYKILIATGRLVRLTSTQQDDWIRSTGSASRRPSRAR